VAGQGGYTRKEALEIEPSAFAPIQTIGRTIEGIELRGERVSALVPELAQVTTVYPRAWMMNAQQRKEADSEDQEDEHARQRNHPVGPRIPLTPTHHGSTTAVSMSVTDTATTII
jgi:hypothetical protein